ncbi:MAG: hypothetical protein CMD08_00460 [Flavobacteriales bacterium]|nr:hypothetical protein [Flavobacteriales bacterium]
MMSSFLLLLLAFILLFFGGDILVRGAVSLALKINVSNLVVGMTVVAFATSAPELFVSIQAILKKSSNIALGNVIGSNIANIALVLGATAIIFRVKISRQSLSLSYPLMLFSSVILGFTLYFFNGIPAFCGFLFVLFLFLFVFILILDSRRNQLHEDNKHIDITEKSSNHSLLKSLIFLLLGVLFLKFGADLLVDSTRILAKYFGVSDRVIAVTVVAIGTSIPELATSIIAAFKKEDGLAVGNLIGSNIFNIFLVLGLTSIITSVKIDDPAILFYDYFWMIGISLLFGVFIYIYSRTQVSRKEGVFLFILYLFYIYHSIYSVI